MTRTVAPAVDPDHVTSAAYSAAVRTAGTCRPGADDRVGATLIDPGRSSMSTRTWIVAAVAVTTVGVSAQPGLAATVRSSHGHIVFTDTAQRVNDVTVTRESGRIRFRDAAITPTAGPGCAPAGQNRVSCPANGVRSVTLLLGPGGDRVIIRPHLLVHAIEIQGGPGADAAKTVGPAISAFGGGGNDRLHGGPLADLLQGGDGDDNLRSADGPDILAGNGGDDLAVGGGGR